MQKYGEIKDLVNAVLESYDKYPVIQNIDCRSRINSESVNDLLEMIRKILFPGYFEIKNLQKRFDRISCRRTSGKHRV